MKSILKIFILFLALFFLTSSLFIFIQEGLRREELPFVFNETKGLDICKIEKYLILYSSPNEIAMSSHELSTSCLQAPAISNILSGYNVNRALSLSERFNMSGAGKASFSDIRITNRNKGNGTMGSALPTSLL